VTEKEVLLGDISMLRSEAKRTRAELDALTKVVEDVLAWKAEHSQPIVVGSDHFDHVGADKRALMAKRVVARIVK